MKEFALAHPLLTAFLVFCLICAAETMVVNICTAVAKSRFKENKENKERVESEVKP